MLIALPFASQEEEEEEQKPKEEEEQQEKEKKRGTAFLSSLGSRIAVITSEKFAVIPNHSKRALEDGPVPWFIYAI